MSDEKKKYASVLMNYFGKRNNQTLTEFAAEVKELTQQDKDDLHDGIVNGSFTY